jgi:DNA-binding MarR family transcriptional regulator
MKKKSPLKPSRPPLSTLANEAQTFFQLFQRLLQKNRFVRKLTVAILSRAEIHVLVELAAMQTRTVSDIVKLLQSEQSSVSRLVQGLGTRGLVAVKPSTSDRRVKNISLTKKGEETVEKIDNVAGALFAEFASRLNASEKTALAKLFREISDEYGQLPGNVRSTEAVLRMEQRRLSRAFGMLGQEAFGSNLTPTQWHVLAEACGRAHPLTGKEACYLLGLAPANLTVVLDQLTSLGYVRRDRDPEDSRLILIYPTPLGKEMASNVEKQFAGRIIPVLKRYPLSEVLHIRDILQRYVGAGTAVELVLNSLPGSYHVTNIKNESERLEARIFVVSRLNAEKLLAHLPESVISKNSLVFTLTHDSEPDKLLAVVEYQLQGGNHALLTLGAAATTLPNNLLYGFLARCEEMMSIAHQIEKTSCTFSPFSGIKPS